MKNSYVSAVLFFFGCVLIGVFYVQSNSQNKPASQSVTLARVVETMGSAQILRKNYRVIENLTLNSSIYYLDTVQTSADALVSIEFPTTNQIRILENSLITLDGTPERTIVTIKNGDIQIVNLGAEGSLIIQKDGFETTASEYERTRANQNMVKKSELQNKLQASPAPTEKEVQDVLKAYRSNFNKCYNILIEKQPAAKGECSISFKIENTGEVSQINFVQNTFKDEKFNECLTEALKRIPFKSYEGKLISALLPLKFE